MRIVTWNIRGALGTDGERNLHRIADTLETCSPDVVCLQEVHRFLPGGGLSDQTSELARFLRMNERFDSAMRGIGCFGNALLSRWPLQPLSPVMLQNIHERKRPGLWLEKRILQRAKVVTPEGSFALMNTHWSLDGDDRLRAAETVSNVVRDTEGLLMLCGDFNAINGSPELVRLDTADIADLGADESAPTYPSVLPRSRIDYVWARGFRRESLVVLPTVASDHCPVLAEIELL